MGRKYAPDNPVIDNFSNILSSNVKKASAYGKCIGTISKGKTLKIKINDNLMKPYLKRGDVVTIKPATIDHVEPGDLLFYRLGDSMLIRKIIRKIERVGESTIFAKAETSRKPEKPIKPSQVFGKVIKIERNKKEVHLPPKANFFQKATAYGTIPVQKIILRALGAMVPFYHPKDELLDEWGRRKYKN